MENVITLLGWVLVHTYYETHGSFVSNTYQRMTTELGSWRKVSLLTITRHRDGSPDTIREEHGPAAHDYLLAKQLQNGDYGLCRADGDRQVSPCYTSGAQNVVIPGGRRFRILSVAGHGEWAWEKTED